MRTFLVLMAAGLLLMIVRAGYEYSIRFGSIDGYVYLEHPDGKVIPMQGITVYLILGRIYDEYHFMEQEYQMQVGPLEASVNQLEDEYNKIQARIAQYAVAYETNNMRRNDNIPAAAMRRLQAMRDSLYLDYKAVKEKYDFIQKSYNTRLGVMINKYSAQQIEANDKGYFNFPKIDRKRNSEYYIFARRHSFLDSYTWFVPIEISGEKQRINLSRKNLTHLFK